MCRREGYIDLSWLDLVGEEGVEDCHLDCRDRIIPLKESN